jgi:hypothetical protein
MLKKTIVAIVAVAALSIASMAHAAWSPEDEVVQIRQSRSSYDNGRTVIKLKNTTCSTGDFYIADTSSNRDIQVCLPTAALLAGRTVMSAGCYDADPLALHVAPEIDAGDPAVTVGV